MYGVGVYPWWYRGGTGVVHGVYTGTHHPGGTSPTPGYLSPTLGTSPPTPGYHNPDGGRMAIRPSVLGNTGRGTWPAGHLHRTPWGVVLGACRHRTGGGY